MTDDRTAVFADIRASLGRGALTSSPARPDVSPAPGIGQCEAAARLSRLRTKLISQAATIALAHSIADVPRLTDEYLHSLDLGIDKGYEARLAPHADLQALDWGEGEINFGAGEINDRIGISRAFTAMAETGTLVLLSGADCPITLCFVPETHIVIIRESEIVAGFEGVWQKIRQKTSQKIKKARSGEAFPRSVNFVSGPSRTADIEQTLELGAHGPLRLHVIVIEDGPA